jgi:hypothetical protein
LATSPICPSPLPSSPSSFPGSLENINMPQESGLLGLVSRQQKCEF